MLNVIRRVLKIWSLKLRAFLYVFLSKYFPKAKKRYFNFGWSNPLVSWNTNAIFSTAITVPEVASPATPAADNLSFFGTDIAGRTFPGFIGSDATVRAGQSFLGQVRLGWWNPISNTATLPASIGLPPLSVNDSSVANARTWAVTNTFTRVRRVGFVGNSVAGRIAGFRWAANYMTLGDGAGVGGFFFVGTFGCSDAATVAGARQWYGLQNGQTVSNVEPSTITNCLMIGNGASDTNLKIYYGGSAAQTPIDLGANFPANTLSTDMYEFALWASPNRTDVSYQVKRLGTSYVATGTLSGTAGTVLPAATTTLGFNAVRCNNATALACALDFGQIYLETAY